MPSNKTLTVFIFCIATVISTWLIFGKTKNNHVLDTKNATSSVTVSNYKDNGVDKNDDWKKILTDLSPQNTNFANLTKTSDVMPPDTTLTAQIAKDVFSTYLLTTKTGGPFTSNTADQVVQSVLSSPDYTESKGAVYITANLHVSGSNDKSSILKYKDDFSKALASRVTEIQNTEDPMVIMNIALQTDNESGLVKIDPIIKSTKGLIDDLLNMNVPSSAVKAHLEVLNAVSNLLSDVEAMRMVFVDPVKSLPPIGRYNDDISKFVSSLGNINQYFERI